MTALPDVEVRGQVSERVFVRGITLAGKNDGEVEIASSANVIHKLDWRDQKRHNAGSELEASDVYEWLPLLRLRHLYEKLTRMRVEVRTRGG